MTKAGPTYDYLVNQCVMIDEQINKLEKELQL